jgi:hypothetical protein
MPINYTIDHATRFVHARAEGTITLKDVEAFLDAVVVQGALPYRKLFDASEATGTYDDNDVMALGARASAYASMARRGPLAIVPRKNMAPDLARRFINLAKYETPARIFRSAAEARKWLDSLPDIKTH